jgi:TonB family protein
MKRLLFSIIVVCGLGVPSLCKVQAPEPECDFSSYKPLIISHALLNAVVKRVEPKYPGLARVSRADGNVQVKILVERDGNVVEACVVDGHPLLRESARQAALEWKFKRNFGFTNRPKRKYIQSFIVFTFRFK